MFEQQTVPEIIELESSPELLRELVNKIIQIVGQSQPIPLPKEVIMKTTGLDSVIVTKADRKGQMPKVETRQVVASALRGKAYRPIRYNQVDEQRLTLTEESLVEVSRVIPQLNCVVFLHANIHSLLSPDKQKKVLAQAHEIIDHFQQMVDIVKQFIDEELVEKFILHVGIKVENLNGCEIVWLNQPTADTTRVSLHWMQEDIDRQFKHQIESTMFLSAISPDTVCDQSAASDSESVKSVNDLMKRFALPPQQIACQTQAYFPPTVVVDLKDSGHIISLISGDYIPAQP